MHLTTLQTWLLQRIFKSVVTQGNHRKRIIAVNSILTQAARAEFTEDNKPTLDGFLEECHKESLLNEITC